MEELTFNLQQAAKKTGGDKYVCETDETFAVYIPQSISRKNNNGKPLQTVKMTITVPFETDAVIVT